VPYRQILTERGDSGFGGSGHGGHRDGRLDCGQQRGGQTLPAGMVDGGLVGIDLGIRDMPVQPPAQQRKPEHHIGGRSGDQPPQRISTPGGRGFVGQDGSEFVCTQLRDGGGEVDARVEKSRAERGAVGSGQTAQPGDSRTLGGGYQRPRRGCSWQRCTDRGSAGAGRARRSFHWLPKGALPVL
jgi:hypothetical protein